MSEPDPAAEVTNPAVREALDEFVADPGARGSIDVLRWCLQGFLLLDVTGSDIRMSADGTEIEPGSTVQIAVTSGPDGESALAAFTSMAEIEKVHSGDGETGGAVQSLVQPAAAVLELAVQQDHRWVCLDPAGPSCALSRDEIDFALRVPRNDVVRQALDVVNVDPDQRPVLLDALRADGVFVLAVDTPDEPADDVPEGTVRLRTTTLPDERPALMVFTSGPEAAARAGSDSFVVWSTAEVHDALRQGEVDGLVVNPSGPWAAVTTEELLGSPAGES
ncbi:SseB family protein [uncultured Jatrophihabitans sp.]|uniref:SseB family protein n=1 Tax=uncultured Jatrophihabitans sp. TaxID=1610747 RepID=UPI0035C9B241